MDKTATLWEVPLGLIVPRDPHFSSHCDASHVGGGAYYCRELEFWFDIAWSPQTVHGIKKVKPGCSGYVHINYLEFIVVILPLVAIRVRMETATEDQLQRFFPNGVPDRDVFGIEKLTTLSLSHGRIAPLPVQPSPKVWCLSTLSFSGLSTSQPSSASTKRDLS